MQTATAAASTATGAAHPVAVERLTKRYGDVTAVDDLSFTVRWGAVTGFLGANGAGKSTTLKVVLGLAAPTSGRATVMGRPYHQLPQPARSVGAVLETGVFHPLRSGRAHLRVLAAAAGIDDSAVDAALERVGLAAAADRRVGGYSLGMRQRLGLASALLGDPRVLVLDEPANGLDPEGIRWLRGLLRDFAAGGGAVLVSSHLLAEVEALADDDVVVHRGRLVRQAPVTELTATAVAVDSPAAARLAAVLAAEGLRVRRDGATRLVVDGASAARVGDAACAAGLPIHGLAPLRTRLEEAFFAMTEQESR